MTKSNAIEMAKAGYAIHHPDTQGFITIKVSYSYIDGESRQVWFNGDCSPKTGWEANWLGEY